VQPRNLPANCHKRHDASRPRTRHKKYCRSKVFVRISVECRRNGSVTFKPAIGPSEGRTSRRRNVGWRRKNTAPSDNQGSRPSIKLPTSRATASASSQHLLLHSRRAFAYFVDMCGAKLFALALAVCCWSFQSVPTQSVARYASRTTAPSLASGRLRPEGGVSPVRLEALLTCASRTMS
jgi:hypothetical protein